MTISLFTGFMIVGLAISILVSIGIPESNHPVRNGILCFCYIVFVVFGLYKMETATPNYIHTSTEYIVALNDNNLTRGKIYLRGGRIDEELWYQYMLKYGAGYKTNRCKAKTSVVYCDNEETPRVEWYDVEKSWFLFKIFDETQKKIYIPEGSIVEDFTIDLQ